MITLSGVISTTDLNANTNEETAQILANLKAGVEDFCVPFDRAALTSNTLFRDRHVVFSPQMDLELRGLRLGVYGLAANTHNTTLKLEACDPIAAYVAATGHPALSEYLLEDTVSVTVQTTSATEVTGSLDRTSTSGKRHILLGGVSYRLVLSTDNTNALARAHGCVILRGRRRLR
jgi:hypothetical protein